ncbi:hypothetical protein ACFO0N_06150 [Halobium salinum]|uniref:Tat (Twin-arginine translocation) pathway signal sequence n=1 Tax=Halobium salinum TaxID=1364940 RepID=A0ABD5P9E3_9EURY|nr:hypothetical protein [Halobium salinum]
MSNLDTDTGRGVESGAAGVGGLDAVEAGSSDRNGTRSAFTSAPRRAGVDRRSLLRTGALALAFGVAGAGGGVRQVAAQPDWWGELTLIQQLREVERLTRVYRRVDAAAADGYESAALPLVCGVGYYFDNAARWADDAVDPTRPESLVYALAGERLRLAAVEYAVATEVDADGNPTTEPPDLFADGETPVDRSPLSGLREVDGWGLVVDGEFAYWDLHVWVHETNPDGVFAYRNPRYAGTPGCVPVGSEPLPGDDEAEGNGAES